ncbi:MAG: DUF2281 domain-containing protein [Bacteroidota bacterium]
MTDQVILRKIHALPENLKGEIIDFIEFLTHKYDKNSSKKKSPRYGSLKGTFQMSEDFDAPLEEFKDYM